MTEYEYAISVQDVGKRYDRFALEHISFTVPKGSIMGFIGQNGAGKTTTIRSMLHITSIDQGEIRLLGMDHIRQEQAIKERLAVVFDELPFHGVLTPKDLCGAVSGLGQCRLQPVSGAVPATGEKEDRAVFQGHENEAANRLCPVPQCGAADYG